MASEDIEFKCFIGDLDSDMEEDDLENAFSLFGEITYSRVIKDQRDSENIKVYGFLTFKEERSMWDAINVVNGQKLEDSSSITVQEANSTRTSRRRRRRGRVDSHGVS